MTALAKAYACTVCSLWEEEDAEELVRLGTPPLRLACVPGDPPCHASMLTLLWLWSRVHGLGLPQSADLVARVLWIPGKIFRCFAFKEGDLKLRVVQLLDYILLRRYARVWTCGSGCMPCPRCSCWNARHAATCLCVPGRWGCCKCTSTWTTWRPLRSARSWPSATPRASRCAASLRCKKPRAPTVVRRPKALPWPPQPSCARFCRRARPTQARSVALRGRSATRQLTCVRAPASFSCVTCPRSRTSWFSSRWPSLWMRRRRSQSCLKPGYVSCTPTCMSPTFSLCSLVPMCGCFALQEDVIRRLAPSNEPVAAAIKPLLRHATLHTTTVDSMPFLLQFIAVRPFAVDSYPTVPRHCSHHAACV